jgi:hypothetical protein
LEIYNSTQEEESLKEVLSPFLFNIVFEEALKSSPLLASIIRRGNLLAYADNFLF